MKLESMAEIQWDQGYPIVEPVTGINPVLKPLGPRWRVPMPCTKGTDKEVEPHEEVQLIGAYVPSEFKILVNKVARNRQESVSTFMRRAILKELGSLGYLDEETKKSLGVETFG